MSQYKKGLCTWQDDEKFDKICIIDGEKIEIEIIIIIHIKIKSLLFIYKNGNEFRFYLF